MKKKISIDAFSVALIAWTSFCVRMLNVFNYYYFRNDHLANAVGVIHIIMTFDSARFVCSCGVFLIFRQLFSSFYFVRATTRLPSTIVIIVCIANNDLNCECATCQCVRSTVLFLNENKIHPNNCVLSIQMFLFSYWLLWLVLFFISFLFVDLWIQSIFLLFTHEHQFKCWIWVRTPNKFNVCLPNWFMAAAAQF